MAIDRSLSLATDPLTISGPQGTVQFLSDEHPPKLEIESFENLAEHELIGGDKVIHDIGTFYKPIIVEGALWTDFLILQRVKTLRQMQAFSDTNRMTWDAEAFDIKIASFRISHAWKGRATYALDLRVLSNANAPQPTTAASADQQLSTFMSDALGSFSTIVAVAPATPPALKTSLEDLNKTLGTNVSASSATGLAKTLQTVQAVQSALGEAQAYLASLGITAPNNLLVSANGLVNTLGVMLKATSAGSQTQSMQVSAGTRLVDIASAVYGDPSVATALAKFNGTGLVTAAVGLIKLPGSGILK